MRTGGTQAQKVVTAQGAEAGFDAVLKPGDHPALDLETLMRRAVPAHLAAIRQMRNVTRWLEAEDTASEMLWAAPEQGAASLGHVGRNVAELEATAALMTALIESSGPRHRIDLAPAFERGGPKGGRPSGVAALPITFAPRLCLALSVIARSYGADPESVIAGVAEGSFRASVLLPSDAMELEDLPQLFDPSNPLGLSDVLPLAFAVIWREVASLDGHLGFRAGAQLEVEASVPVT